MHRAPQGTRGRPLALTALWAAAIFLRVHGCGSPAQERQRSEPPENFHGFAKPTGPQNRDAIAIARSYESSLPRKMASITASRAISLPRVATLWM